jgi:hypothetical protein
MSMASCAVSLTSALSFSENLGLSFLRFLHSCLRVPTVNLDKPISEMRLSEKATSRSAFSIILILYE